MENRAIPPRTPLDVEAAWTAFERRDRAADGRFVVAVKTTGIYCRPSCAARRPRREHVTFYADGASAGAAGFRACLRCLPDAVARDRRAVAEAITMIEMAQEMPALSDLAERVGYAPHHFHRLFRRATGVTPAAYARACRAARTTEALSHDMSITRALYEAGYAGPSRFYAASEQRLGMAPGQWRRGGGGVTIDWAVMPTPLGPLLIAATPRGLARIAFEADGTALTAAFPAATIRAATAETLHRLMQAVAEADLADPQLPEATRRTAFVEAVSCRWLASVTQS
ncbi:bifunctional transcriptional activator/DNA repair enzyme AdaA [Sphingomonas sp. NPDC019816]|uniref:bifunctional transcriptional activator/DNA repair enzyme AdaA n=1 Tax=Sphingomonas sp. NPDC019816 TaxID=3390679 RepID=UPI003D02E0C5